MYKVKVGTWIELHMLNRGVQVDIEFEREQMGAHSRHMRHYHGVRLVPGEEHCMNTFRIGGNVIDVRVLDDAHRPLLHMQFESVGAVKGSEQSRRGPGGVGGLLAQLLDAR